MLIPLKANLVLVIETKLPVVPDLPDTWFHAACPSSCIWQRGRLPCGLASSYRNCSSSFSFLRMCRSPPAAKPLAYEFRRLSPVAPKFPSSLLPLPSRTLGLTLAGANPAINPATTEALSLCVVCCGGLPPPRRSPSWLSNAIPACGYLAQRIVPSGWARCRQETDSPCSCSAEF